MNEGKENLSPYVWTEKTIQNVQGYYQVMIHIETTGLENDANIIKLSALAGSDSFIAFLTPDKRINPGATKLNHLELNSQKRLCYRGQPVEEGLPKDQLIRFKEWLQERSQSPVVLVGHNCKSFVAPRLLYNLKRHGLEENFEAIVIGFLDTLTLSRAVFPGRKKYDFPSLAKDIVGLGYDAHSDLEYVLSLQKLMANVSKAMALPQSEVHLDKFSLAFPSKNVNEKAKIAKRTLNDSQQTNRSSAKPAKKTKILTD